jgi:hypothetical protein
MEPSGTHYLAAGEGGTQHRCSRASQRAFRARIANRLRQAIGAHEVGVRFAGRSSIVESTPFGASLAAQCSLKRHQ